MPKRWFKLPAKKEQIDEKDGGGKIVKPNLFGHDVKGFSGTDKAFGDSDNFLVKVNADLETLNALENEPRAVEFSDIPKQELDKAFGQNYSKEEWDKRFG